MLHGCARAYILVMNTTDPHEIFPVVTPTEFMHALRCGRSKAYRLIRDNKIGSVKVGRRILIPRSALIALLTPKPKGA